MKIIRCARTGNLWMVEAETFDPVRDSIGDNTQVFYRLEGRY
jgi:hypothetical protein